MKLNLKKILAVTAAAALSGALLAGCAKTVPGGGKIGDPVFVTVVDKGFGAAWMQAVGDAYFEETGVEVTVSADPDLYTNLQTKMDTSAEKDDMYFVSGDLMSWRKWAQKKLIQPLDDVLESDKYGTPAIDRMRDDVFIKLGKYDGVLYELPYVYSAWGMVYNQGYLNQIDSYGAYVKGQFPDTFQGFLDLCAATNAANIVNNKTSNVVKPLAVGNSKNYMNNLFYSYWYQLDPQGFVNYYDQNDRNAYNGSLLDTPAVLKSLEMAFDITGAKSATESNLVGASQSHLDSQRSFLNGDSVVVMTGTWFESEMCQALETSKIDYHFAAYPKAEGSAKTAMQMNLPGEFFFIPSDAPNVNGAKDFLNFALSEKGLTAAKKALNQELCFKTEKTVEINSFGTEMSALLESANRFYTFSTGDVFTTGALGLFMQDANPFLSMAKFNIKSKAEIKKEVIDKEIAKHKERWPDYMALLV